MFGTILIANRGEIACRVMRTAQRMGVRCVAVYSDADRDALHVRMADEAYHIGAAPARESYLVAERIIEAARQSGAQAVHPGYGFLSENADFAEACGAAGLVFIGPPAAAIRAMGSKAAAKALMARAGVALVPGYHGDAQDAATFTRACADIGYPVLIKASAGGGGKGMRVVEREADLAAALEAARREAAASFGDDRVLVEKYLGRPRHIEIQVFADTHGHCVSLFERDCSIQRRHQKVLEEAPAPLLSVERRAAMGAAAVAAAKAVNYVGAGTVEFIAEGDRFYFMEMNTRLQVEHPVTECVTGLDLVEWQLRVACGEALPVGEADLRLRGHAIEARLYAEDPSRGFLPSTGTLAHLQLPAYGQGVRVDTGVRQGDAITPYYDPMIAKLIVYGSDRAAAVSRLRAALDDCQVAGVHTNLELLRAIASTDAYAAGEVDTGFIGRHPEVLNAETSAIDRGVARAAAALDVLQRQVTEAPVAACDPYSPWGAGDAWRMNGMGYQDLLICEGADSIQVRAHRLGGGAWRLDWPSGGATAELAPDGGSLRLDGVLHRLAIVPRPGGRTVILRGRNHDVTVDDPLAPPLAQGGAEGRLTAPIPARVTRVMVMAGDTVAKGAVLLTLEAMKMEISISAPFDGVIEQVRHEAGDMVEEGMVLVEFAAGARS
jgi:3-methylcrotonyl-CoA carboxylase alpha subunit